MNDNTLPNWPRELYEQSESNPFLFYVVFGSSVEDLKLSRSKYRCDEIPQGLELLSYGANSHPEVLDQFRSGYLWEELQLSEPALYEAIAAQQQCVVIRGTLGDGSSLNYFRNTIGLVTCLLDNGGIGIFDPQSFKWWSTENWRNIVFEPAQPLPLEHVVILVSEEPDGTHWFHTRGLRKFGRPDLSIHNVPPQYHRAVVDLFNRFIELQAFGGVIPEGQVIRMESLPADMYCVHSGSEDDPDFNNTHVEVCWPRNAGQGAPVNASTAAPSRRV